MKKNDKIKEILFVKEMMTKNPVTVTPEDRLDRVIEFMSSLNIGSIIVVKDQKPINIITQRDIVRALYLGCKDIKVDEFLNKCKTHKKLKFISQEDSVYNALNLFEKENIKHLPVVDTNHKLVGIVTATDILRSVTHIAIIDPLTKVYNRRYLNIVLYKVRGKSAYALLMLDIDDFKKVNDSYGHDFGDIVLKKLSKILVENVRNYDDVIRYGGEEFLVVLYRVSEKEAINIAERIRKAFQNTKYNEAKNLKITISIGVAKAKKEESLFDVIKRADEALYLAKQKGKNRVELSISHEQKI